MYTEQQQSAINALLYTTSNLALVARAGCGKTYTIMEMINSYAVSHPNAEIAVAAYNAAIAAEVKAKLEQLGFNWRQVQASTAHALGKSLLKFRFNDPKINENKVRDIIDAQQCNSEVCRNYGPTVERLVCLAKQSGFGYFSWLEIDNHQEWLNLADHYGVDDCDDEEAMSRCISVAQWVYRKSIEDTTAIDFDDMILMPLYYNIRVKFTKDLVFVDEAQDLSRTRQALLRKFVKPGTGRMIVVGDDRQAIYGFSGADSEALPRMIEELNATVLPLNVTWRCGRAVVAKAQEIVPDIRARDGAVEGQVINIDTLPTDLSADDFILCRNTSPLITTAYTLMKARIPCKVEGRDIGRNLKALAQRWKVKTVSALLGRLDDYEKREISKALTVKNERKAEEIHDRVESLRFICNEVILVKLTLISDVVQFIDSLFGDDVQGVVTLATYHRSKGREKRRVILIEHHRRCPSRYAKKDHELLQESNLAYVAMTRAKEVLAFYTPKAGAGK